MPNIDKLSDERRVKGKFQPLYVQLANTLYGRIDKGDYPIGSLLPTEAELGRSFGVSRHTVRQAIQHLRLQGVVTAKKGVGTRVDAKAQPSSYTQSAHSLAELKQYAQATKLELRDVGVIKVRGQLATALCSRPGTDWLYVKGARVEPGQPKPICLSELYLDHAFRSIADRLGGFGVSISDLIEREFGETIVEVEQTLEAVVLGQEEARELVAEPNSAAIRVTRRYFANGRRLLEMAISLHPADRFSYTMSLKRDFSHCAQH